LKEEKIKEDLTDEGNIHEGPGLPEVKNIIWLDTAKI
jgi:hypothetical protein